MSTSSAIIDWIAAAKAAPILCIGQHTPTDTRALNAAVRRGELVKGRAPFFGRMAEKTCYAASYEAIAAKVAADQCRFDTAVARDSFNRLVGVAA